MGGFYFFGGLFLALCAGVGLTIWGISTLLKLVTNN